MPLNAKIRGDQSLAFRDATSTTTPAPRPPVSLPIDPLNIPPHNPHSQARSEAQPEQPHHSSTLTNTLQRIAISLNAHTISAAEAAALTMTHQHKRPYAGSQPSITAYFAPQISPTNTIPHNYSITPSPTSPSYNPSANANDLSGRASLPANVQSNLLSVGMRIRKSVPEGYKTGSYSSFTLFSDTTPTPPAQPQTQPQTQLYGNSKKGLRPRARELTPFCGILKVGGMGVQSGWEEEDDDVPALSQGSTVSNDTIDCPATPASDRKRRFDHEDEDELGNVQDRVTILGAEFGGRVMAVPRRKSKVVGMQKENLDIDGDIDFGEAEFLDFGFMGEKEVEMGGV